LPFLFPSTSSESLPFYLVPPFLLPYPPSGPERATNPAETTRYNDDLSLEDAIHTALLTLKEGFEGQMTEQTIEIGVVTVPTPEQMQEKPGERLPPTFRKLTEQEVRDYLAL
jgi:hypothetical protein